MMKYNVKEVIDCRVHQTPGGTPPLAQTEIPDRLYKKRPELALLLSSVRDGGGGVEVGGLRSHFVPVPTRDGLLDHRLPARPLFLVRRGPQPVSKDTRGRHRILLRGALSRQQPHYVFDQEVPVLPGLVDVFHDFVVEHRRALRRGRSGLHRDRHHDLHFMVQVRNVVLPPDSERLADGRRVPRGQGLEHRGDLDAVLHMLVGKALLLDRPTEALEEGEHPVVLRLGVDLESPLVAFELLFETRGVSAVKRGGHVLDGLDKGLVCVSHNCERHGHRLRGPRRLFRGFVRGGGQGPRLVCFRLGRRLRLAAVVACRSAA
eukprot:Hpha_TRINITY_DN16889_c2_g1::TRINITY_DN16889_c2_g1_i1::g.148267::m.148267